MSKRLTPPRRRFASGWFWGITITVYRAFRVHCMVHRAYSVGDLGFKVLGLGIQTASAVSLPANITKASSTCVLRAA